MLLLIILIFGCAAIPPQTPLTFISKTKSVKGIDFREYTEKGFLFTPEKYQGDYESIGLLNFSISSEAVLEKILVSEVNEMARKAGLSDVYRYKWNIEEINYKEVLDLAYDTSISMGGDAIINFEINYDVNHYRNADGYPSVYIPKINVTGFVIKRK